MKRAEFSQYGPGLGVVAPGVNVVSSVPRGAGRASNVMVDYGDGATRVPSSSLQGAPENENAVSGNMVFAGLGKPEDIQKVNLSGKVALIQRGEITFRDKVTNAINAGASAVVIFNNADGLARGGLGDPNGMTVPVAMIQATLAQGKAVSVSIKTEATDYDAYDGTSMATPHVSGVAALVKSVNHNLTPVQVRQILESTATDMGDKDQYGAGLVNAEAAVKCDSRAPCFGILSKIYTEN